MKKIMALLVVFALFAGVAFGDAAEGFWMNAWGRAAFSIQAFSAPKANGEVVKGADGKDLKGETYAGLGATWGGGEPRVDYRLGFTSDFVGFRIKFTADAGNLGTDEDAHIWAKPFGNDFLKLTAGKLIEDALRGKIGNLDGGFTNYVLGNSPEEDNIFSRFTSGQALLISSAPIDGLFIGLMLSGNQQGDGVLNTGGWGGNSPTYAANVFRTMQIGAGFNIANIGHIRAQYIGGWSGEIDKSDADTAKYYAANPQKSRIEAAFALTAIDGLLIDLGGKFHMPWEEKGSFAGSGGVDFSLGANFNTGIIGIGARFDATGLGGYDRNVKDDKNENGMGMLIRVVPSLALDFAKIGLDVAFEINGESKDKDGVGKKDNTSRIGFGAFIEKGLGKGSFKFGLAYTLAPTNNDGKANGSDVFSVPIILEYAFF
jgi:hypothetical protein